MQLEFFWAFQWDKVLIGVFKISFAQFAILLLVALAVAVAVASPKPGFVAPTAFSYNVPTIAGGYALPAAVPAAVPFFG